MADKRSRNFRGISEPVLVREPLLVRLCVAFVENLTLILKAALVVGVVLLVRDLRTFLEEVNQPVVESVLMQAVPLAIEEIGETGTQEPVLSDRVKQALNCTYANYRNTHFDECVKEPSSIYPRPDADPDNTGLIIFDTPVLFAPLDNYTGLE